MRRHSKRPEQTAYVWQSRQQDCFLPNLIDEFSSPYVQKVREAVEDENFVVMYHNRGNIIPLLNNVKSLDASAYSFETPLILKRL